MKKGAFVFLALIAAFPAFAQEQTGKAIAEGVIQSLQDRAERLKKPLFDRAAEWRCDIKKRNVCGIADDPPTCKTTDLSARSISVAKKSGQNSVSIRECGGILKDVLKDNSCDDTVGIVFQGDEETDIYYASFGRPLARIDNDGGNITIVTVSSQTTIIEHGRCAPK